MSSIFLRGEGVDPFATRRSRIPRRKLLELERWLKRAAVMLGLPHYRVSVSANVPNGSEATAETFHRDASSEIVVAFDDRFFDWPELHRRGVLLHELLHGWTHPLSIFARDQAENEFGARAFAIYEAALGDMEEKLVDTMGHALAPLFPPSPD